MSRTPILPALLACTISAGWLGAQDPDPVGPGARIRVTAPSVNPSKLIGAIESTSPENIILRVVGQESPLIISRSALVKLEVSRGKRSVGKAALKGLGIGAAAGAIVGLVTIPFTCPHTSDNLCDDDFSDAFYPVSGAIVAAPLGALVGAISAAVSGERWKEVPINRFHVAIAPIRGRGFAVRVSVGL